MDEFNRTVLRNKREVASAQPFDDLQSRITSLLLNEQ